MTKSSLQTDQTVPFRGFQPEWDEITPEIIDHHIAYGNRLRSAMIAQMISRAWHGFARLWRGDVATVKASPETVAEKFANSLAAIRSSAEQLRDVPGLSKSQHDRFVRIVLEEEVRLERLLDELRVTPASSARAA